MLFDQSFFMTLVSILLGIAGITGIATGIVKFCQGYSWSYRPSRIYSKHNER
jgi:hypothetical protein